VIRDKIEHPEVGFPDEQYPDRECHVSSAAKDLLKKMLMVDPESRITLDGVLKHPWLKRQVLSGDEE